MGQDADALLKSMLPLAVFMNTPNFQQMPWERLQEIATEASQFMAEHGDDLLFKSKKKGDTAKAFNLFAKGVTVLSFAPGGVNIMGMHFEAVHPGQIAAGHWLYHSTFADALPRIAKEGLQPDSEGKIFFTGLIPMAAGHADMLFATMLTENGWSWNPILLRAFSPHLGDIQQESYRQDDWYIERAVPAVFIQVWLPEKQLWTEVRDAAKQGYFSNARTKYGEPGEINVDPGASPRDYAIRYIEQFWPKHG